MMLVLMWDHVDKKQLHLYLILHSYCCSRGKRAAQKRLSTYLIFVQVLAASLCLFIMSYTNSQALNQ
jgi:hypothetical protein